MPITLMTTHCQTDYREHEKHNFRIGVSFCLGRMRTIKYSGMPRGSRQVANRHGRKGGRHGLPERVRICSGPMKSDPSSSQ